VVLDVVSLAVNCVESVHDKVTYGVLTAAVNIDGKHLSTKREEILSFVHTV